MRRIRLVLAFSWASMAACSAVACTALPELKFAEDSGANEDATVNDGAVPDLDGSVDADADADAIADASPCGTTPLPDGAICCGTVICYGPECGKTEQQCRNQCSSCSAASTYCCRKTQTSTCVAFASSGDPFSGCQ